MLPLSGTAMMLSLKINLDVKAAGDLALTIGFDIEGTPYRASLTHGLYHVEAGQTSQPDLAYTGTARGLAARFYGKAPLAQLAMGGVLNMVGDAALEACFNALFDLPSQYVPAERPSTPPA